MSATVTFDAGDIEALRDICGDEEIADYETNIAEGRNWDDGGGVVIDGLIADEYFGRLLALLRRMESALPR